MAKAAKKSKFTAVDGHLKSSIKYIVVDNPYFDPLHGENNGNPKTTKAAFNMNESVSAHWYNKGLISDAAMLASTNFRRWYEIAEGCLGIATDYSQPVVDGGGPKDPINTRRAEAIVELRNIRLRLGPQGYETVEKLCGQCLKIASVSDTRHHQRKIAESCQAMLEELAVYLGYKTRQIKGKKT